MRRIYEYSIYLGASASKDLSYNFYLPMMKKKFSALSPKMHIHVAFIYVMDYNICTHLS
jgi:hypothetical protein